MRRDQAALQHGVWKNRGLNNPGATPHISLLKLLNLVIAHTKHIVERLG